MYPADARSRHPYLQIHFQECIAVAFLYGWGLAWVRVAPFDYHVVRQSIRARAGGSVFRARSNHGSDHFFFSLQGEILQQAVDGRRDAFSKLGAGGPEPEHARNRENDLVVSCPEIR